MVYLLFPFFSDTIFLTNQGAKLSILFLITKEIGKLISMHSAPFSCYSPGIGIAITSKAVHSRKRSEDGSEIGQQPIQCMQGLPADLLSPFTLRPLHTHQLIGDGLFCCIDLREESICILLCSLVGNVTHHDHAAGIGDGGIEPVTHHHLLRSGQLCPVADSYSTCFL